jgi:hypothetical protein
MLCSEACPRRNLANVVAYHMESEGMKAITRRELAHVLNGPEDLRTARRNDMTVGWRISRVVHRCPLATSAEERSRSA